MKLGLGTGSTAACFVELLGAKVAQGLAVVAVPTSEATRRQAQALGIPLSTLDETPFLDMTVDGADEIDSELRLIKGGGGAHLREKIVAMASERLIVIEDTAEVRLDHPNAVGLIAVRGELGEARIGVDDLLQASLRMRPDRIILGELRGAEAYSFLRAVNSGHPGSITTVHADNPRAAVDQIALMVLQAGANLRRQEIADYVGGVVDVAVQLTRRDGRRVVSDIAFRPKAFG